MGNCWFVLVVVAVRVNRRPMNLSLLFWVLYIVALVFSLYTNRTAIGV